MTTIAIPSTLMIGESQETLRAQAAIAAMQTLMGDKRYSYCDVAIDAVAYADALMAELAK